MLSGDADFHELTGMVARLLGRQRSSPGDEVIE